jgi:hypothetical protein
MDTYRRDRGSIVVGWLTKLIVALSVVGVILFDVVSVTVSHVSAVDDASEAATAAGFEWRATHDVQKAYDAALESLSSDAETIPVKSFTIDTVTGIVRLDVKRETQTMIARHIGPLKHFGVQTAHGESEPPTL